MDTVHLATAVDKLRAHLFQIFTPQGSGTGFQIFVSDFSGYVGIATAYHVISHSYEWELPIRIRQHETGKEILLHSSNRFMFVFPSDDLAFILFHPGEMVVPPVTYELVPEDRNLREGLRVCWLGYPSVAQNNLCFFSGHVSAYLSNTHTYLIDGVAINGVSGGPAFRVFTPDSFMVCGVVSAYLPNRVGGETLPGLCMIQTINAFHEQIRQIKSIDDAKRLEQENAAKADSSSTEKQP